MIPSDHTSTIIGFGLSCQDYLSICEKYPERNEKIRNKESKVFIGGGSANVICNFRLLNEKHNCSYLITILGNDTIKDFIVNELEKKYSVDTSCIITSKYVSSSFSYIIVHKESRTCIHTPLELNEKFYKEMNLEKVKKLLNKGENYELMFFDGRYPKIFYGIMGLIKTPILLNYERIRNKDVEFIILKRIDYLITSENIPLIFDDDQLDNKDLLNYMTKYLECFSNLKWIITTLGEKGSVLLIKEDSNLIKNEKISSKIHIIKSLNEIFELSDHNKITNWFLFKNYKLLYCKKFNVNVIDTTGAGDSFTASIIFSILNNFNFKKMMSFASYCAAFNCQNIGAVNLNDSLLQKFNAKYS